MHIFLIRHGESQSNAGENYIKRNPKNCWIREIKDGKDMGYINK